jgi:hypothetical protein
MLACASNQAARSSHDAFGAARTRHAGVVHRQQRNLHVIFGLFRRRNKPAPLERAVTILM